MHTPSVKHTDVTPADGAPLLTMSGIYKSFQAVQALQDVDLVVRTGEVHALMGGNGAGKSTLLNILSGVIQPDAGTIRLDGIEHVLHHPAHAQRLGIATIHQELSTIPDLTVIENVLLGHESALTGGAGRLVNRRSIAKRIESLAQEFGITRSELWTPVGEFGALKKRAIEIIKALAVEPRVLILDEPTSGLEAHEKESLFDHMRMLQRRGVALIWVTHHLDEIFGLADVVTVMRDGRTITRTDADELTPRRLAAHMFGTEASELIDTVATETSVRPSEEQHPRLKVENLSRAGVLRDISFELGSGEILGVAGLAGAGRTELVRALMGMDKVDAGQLYLDGRKVKISHPRTAYKLGLAMVPEDRKQLGILGEFSIEKNISLSRLSTVARGGIVNQAAERRLAQKYVDRLRIKTPSTHEKIRNLSGGNQQKAVIARCLNAAPRILIVDEPTQGVDVHAKVEVHNLIRDLTADGTSVILIASEFTELIGLCDRVLTLNRGALVGEVDNVRERVLRDGFDAVKQTIIDHASKVGR